MATIQSGHNSVFQCFASLGLFMREVGRHKKQDWTIFAPLLYGDFRNRDGITRQDGMIFVLPFQAWFT